MQGALPERGLRKLWDEDVKQRCCKYSSQCHDCIAIDVEEDVDNSDTCNNTRNKFETQGPVSIGMVIFNALSTPGHCSQLCLG